MGLLGGGDRGSGGEGGEHCVREGRWMRGEEGKGREIGRGGKGKRDGT